MLSEKNIHCYACHKQLDLAPAQRILRNEECPYCFASLHCCRMCKFYDKTAYNQCRETNADRIVEKEKANFCDYFTLKGDSDGGNDKSDLLSAANALFK